MTLLAAIACLQGYSFCCHSVQEHKPPASAKSTLLSRWLPVVFFTIAVLSFSGRTWYLLLLFCSCCSYCELLQSATNCSVLTFCRNVWLHCLSQPSFSQHHQQNTRDSCLVPPTIWNFQIQLCLMCVCQTEEDVLHQIV